MILFWFRDEEVLCDVHGQDTCRNRSLIKNSSMERFVTDEPLFWAIFGLVPQCSSLETFEPSSAKERSPVSEKRDKITPVRSMDPTWASNKFHQHKDLNSQKLSNGYLTLGGDLCALVVRNIKSLSFHGDD